MRRWLLLLVMLAGLHGAGHALAQPTEPEPEELRALVELLGDPAILAWLQAQAEAAPAEGATAAARDPAEAGAMGMAERRLEAMRAQLHAMAAALPRVPGQLASAWATLERDLSQAGMLWALLLVAGFVGLGFGAQLAYWALTGPTLRHIVALPMDTVAERVAATLKRFGWGLGSLAAFALGSVGAFLLFDWPPLLRTVVLAYLIAFLGLRLGLVLGRFLLAPGAEKFRIVPMTTDAAWFWRWPASFPPRDLWRREARASTGRL